MLNTGDLAQAEKNVTINKPIEKIGELLMEKCKTGGYRDDCIPDMGIYTESAGRNERQNDCTNQQD